MRQLTHIGAAAAVVALSACSGMELERNAGLSPSGSEFNRALFTEYTALARSEQAQGDHESSDAYALRARAAAQARPVEPEEIAARDLPADKVQDLTSARGRLVSALRANATTRSPANAAKAQAMFDCWMEQQEENHQPPHIEACRSAFFAALAQIETAPQAAQPAAAPDAMMVYFPLNRANLTADAQREIDRIVARIRASNARSVVLTGHADRSGSTARNMALSRDRVAAVRDAIRRAGVNVQFSESAMGESSPAVRTADNVAEARNRRVEVRILP